MHAANGSYALVRILDPGQTAVLPTITVQVSPDADSGLTEGTGSYTTRAMGTATGLALSPRETPQSVSIVTRQQIGLYAAGRFSIVDPLKLIVGARYTSWNNNLTRTFGVVPPYAGIVWDVSRDLSLYASYTDIFQPQDYQDSSGAHLDPVRGKNYEAGLDTRQTTLQLNINNLFDRKYYSQANFYSTRNYGDPRNFMVTASHKF